MRKNSHSKILKGKPKEQHLNTVPKSCSLKKKKKKKSHSISFHHLNKKLYNLWDKSFKFLKIKVKIKMI